MLVTVVSTLFPAMLTELAASAIISSVVASCFFFNFP
jgi:hypothetical protein